MIQIIIFAATYLFWIIIAIALIVILFSERITKILFLQKAAIAIPLSFFFGKIASSVFYNPRPFVVEHIEPLISHAANNGFPSDHTLFATTVAGIIFLYHKRIGLLLIVLTLIIGVARVLAKVHSPVDIISGIAIAIFAIYLSTVIGTLIRKSLQSKREMSYEQHKT